MNIDSHDCLQFCTNNYLGLAADPRVIEAARTAIGRYGFGSGASRLVAGSMEAHHALESALATFKGTQSALVFSSGYVANLAVLTSLAGPRDTIISDKLNHASLLDAARYSGARHRVFPHLNYRRAATLLRRSEHQESRCLSDALRADDNAEDRNSMDSHPTGKTFLVTDTVFSMDGDIANLPELCSMAEQTNALAIIDEAHATGVLGPNARGLASLQHVEPNIAVTVGTLSKAFGCVGGFVAGSAPMVETLVQKARGFIYSTALPAACSAAALVALEIIQREPERQVRVLESAARVKAALQAMGYNCGQSCTPIIPVLLGKSQTALAAAEWLKSNGIFVPAIRPPTVPPNTARLRISLMATHTDEDIEELLRQMKSMRDQPFLDIVPIL